ncbi:MAG: YceI family protein [Spirochaetota bacterium]
MRLFLAIFCFLLLSTWACVSAKDCWYYYNPSKTKLEWRAFRFLEKQAIRGTFYTIKVDARKQYSTSYDLLADLKFKVYTQSIFTADKQRDERIYKHFFAKLRSGKWFKGSFSNISDNTATLSLNFNQQSQKIPITYQKDGQGNIKFAFTIDLLDWGTTKVFKQFRTLYYQYLLSKNGTPFLWSQVEVYAHTKLDKRCY